MKFWRYGFEFGPLHVESCSRTLTRLGWVSDDLHIWWGKRGVHMSWKRSPYMRRITFDRIDYW